MSEQTQHTPGPWEAIRHIDHHGTDVIVILGKEDYLVAELVDSDTPVSANAQFIVTACNAHEDLVEALDRLLKPFSQGDGTTGYEVRYEMIQPALRALAKARRIAPLSVDNSAQSS